MNVIIRPITAAEIAVFLPWQYEPPYDVYNMLANGADGDAFDEMVAYFLEPENHCCAILHEGEFIGFCTFGADGQVAGGDYSQPALDVGMGMKPELTGQKRGQHFIAAAIQYATEMFPSTPLRATIAAKNGRAQHMCKKVGFVRQEEFICPRNGKAFVVFVR